MRLALFVFACIMLATSVADAGIFFRRSNNCNYGNCNYTYYSYGYTNYVSGAATVEPANAKELEHVPVSFFQEDVAQKAVQKATPVQKQTVHQKASPVQKVSYYSDYCTSGNCSKRRGLFRRWR